jgi:MFS family permease
MSIGKISTVTPGAATLLHHPPFLLFLSGRTFSAMAYQISVVAVGWQIYALTRSAFDLGMVGLTAFLPMAGCTFLAGHIADRYARQRVVQLCQLLEAAIAAYLAAGSFFAWLTVPEIFIAVACFGTARSFESPAQSALLAGSAPPGLLQKATALSSGAMQTATIIGPALGGLAYALSPALPYAAMAACWLGAATVSAQIQLERPVAPKEPPTLRALFAGAAFVRANPAILGTISLDLFAVLLGGASALFPIYARDILHTGPWGLGLLRGALALGSLSMTIALARRTISHRVGMRMFQAVIIFGLATILFSLSRSLPLSLAALVIMGASDTISVIIRMSLVQLRTPDDMRGRVGAVNFLFINASNQLGEFESGMTAALFGAIPAAALGGFGTIAIALLWMKFFPALRTMERLE